MRAGLFSVMTALVMANGSFSRAAGGSHGFIDELAASPSVSISTIPANGDSNPYGITVVQADGGVLHKGDVLIANFNSSSGFQGTGTTIVRIDPNTQSQSVFFDASTVGVMGVNTALAVLANDVVVVGATPLDTSGATPTVDNGVLLFIDANGNLITTLSDSQLLRGPWDMTVNDSDPRNPRLFVSCVLDGSVVRIDTNIGGTVGAPTVQFDSLTRIGSGFAFRTDTNALVVGPTGLAWQSAGDRLFVADTGANRLARLDDASDVGFDEGNGATVFSGGPLQGPLGLVLTPQRHLLMVNGDAQASNNPFNLLIEATTNGSLVDTRQLDNQASGALFGIALGEFQGKTSLFYVDDNSATLNILQTH
jgi:hypothetical protein